MQQTELKSILHYDAPTGVFRWRKEMKHGRIKPWSIAGCVDGDGYIKIKFDQQDYRAHRLA